LKVRVSTKFGVDIDIVLNGGARQNKAASERCLGADRANVGLE
jgi:hypothetical protein